MSTFVTEDELMHYGVPGMKWGVRKQKISNAVNRRKVYRKSTTMQYRYEHDSLAGKLLKPRFSSTIRKIAESNQVDKAYKKASKTPEYKKAISTAAAEGSHYISKPGTGSKIRQMLGELNYEYHKSFEGESALRAARKSIESEQTKLISSYGDHLVNAYINRDIKRANKKTMK